MFREPENSWEVSYVLGLKHPQIHTGVSMFSLKMNLSYSRRVELEAWADRYFTPEWLNDHTLA